MLREQGRCQEGKKQSNGGLHTDTSGSEMILQSNSIPASKALENRFGAIFRFLQNISVLVARRTTGIDSKESV
jgi:hypothetical protein